MNNTIYLFINVLACILAVGSTVVLIIKLWLHMTYQNSVKKSLDYINGCKRTFPIKKTLIIIIISYAWVIALIMEKTK